MDMSKGNLEPVRGSRLPVKVGKDMNQEEICQLDIKKTLRPRPVFHKPGAICVAVSR